MPTLQVITVPPKFAENPALALRQPCAAVDITSPDEQMYARWVIQELFEVLYTKGDGVGLSAPQLGILLRIFVIDCEDGEPLAFVNPEFTYTSSETLEETEGCLSIPGYFGWVSRAAEVTMHAISPSTWEPFEIKAQDFQARVLQHEYDHLNGTLFVDHLESVNDLERSEPYGVIQAQRTIRRLNMKPVSTELQWDQESR